MIGVFWSGFSAWREEKNARVAAENARNTAQTELASRPVENQAAIEQLRAQLSRVESRASQAETQLRELRAQTSPRSVTPAMQAELVPLLRALGPKSVRVDSVSNSESQDFAEQLRSLFLVAGWDSPPGNTGMFFPSPKGVVFNWKSEGQPPQWVGRLGRILENTGIIINHAGGHDSRLPNDDSLIIIVGDKP